MIKSSPAMGEIETITSRENRRLAEARKVRDGKTPGLMFVEGRRLTLEALRSDITVKEAFFVQGFGDRQLRSAVMKRTSTLAEVSEKPFRWLADTDHSQGVVLIAERPETSAHLVESRISKAELPIVLFLKEINNPLNLGAIFRNAEAADAAGVIVSKNSADVFSPKALRAAMGSSFRLPVWDNVDFVGVLKWAKRRALITTAADVLADTNYTRIDWKIPRLLVFGSEAHGLTESEMGAVEQTTRITMDNGVESLNLSVSTAIILFEAKRQMTVE